MMRCSLVVAVLALLIFSTVYAQGAKHSLVIGTWGGPYEAAQKTALFTPFELYSNVNIETSDYTGGLDVFDSASPPDLLDMLEDEASVACKAGLLKKINHADLSEVAMMGESDQQALLKNDDFRLNDFHKGAFAPCSVAHLTFSTLIAFDERAFTGEKPSRINDLFDLERFPGKRALQRSPAALFEWAMMAEGVPITQIYDLLSTERGLRLVTKRIESLRGHVVWWDKPGEAVELLEQGKVVMASGYNGRFFDSWRRGAPINMIWDGQIIDRSVWGIPSASKTDKAIALSFLRFALHPERLAHMATQIPYGPLRSSAFSYIGLHSDSGIVMRDHLPTADHHLVNALYRDTRWYARTVRLRQAYFSRWMSGDVQIAD